MGRKGKPPFIQQTTGNPYLDFFAAAVSLAIRDIEHPCAARPHDAYSALAFLTRDPVAAGLRELNRTLGDAEQERDSNSSRG